MITIEAEYGTVPTYWRKVQKRLAGRQNENTTLKKQRKNSQIQDKDMFLLF